MSTITAFLAALGLGALLFADALLHSERLARAAHPARALWAAHAAHVLVAQIAVLAFGWSRLHFSPSSAPSPFELLALAGAWTTIHLLADIALRRWQWAAETCKVASLLPLAGLLQLRHAEWTALAQGPILFLGQSVAIADFTLNLALFFGVVWAGLAWRSRALAATRLGLVLVLVSILVLGPR